jgi:hypothetical protein
MKNNEIYIIFYYLFLGKIHDELVFGISEIAVRSPMSLNFPRARAFKLINNSIYSYVLVFGSCDFSTFFARLSLCQASSGIEINN